jgi:hypothetical protein
MLRSVFTLIIARRASLGRVALGLSLAGVGACGSSPPPAGSSPSEAEHASAAKGERHAESSDDEGESAPAPKRAACDDGTCSPCGNALCPSGWYCDESAPGGPACGWLPECAQKPGCACVKRAFAGCSCEDKSGAAHLACKQ